MSKPVSIPNSFANQAGPIPLSQLDGDFTTVAAAINDYATYGNYLTDISGAANQITVTTPLNTTFSYTSGVGLQIKVAFSTTSATVYINVDSLGNQLVVNSDGSPLIAGQVVAGQIVPVIYDGTNFRLLGSGAAASSGSFTATLTGYAAGPTGTMYYRITGGVCTLTLLASITGTSNSTGLSITGIPSICNPLSGTPYVICTNCENNSVTGFIGIARAIGGGQVVIDLAQVSGILVGDVSGASWTASGVKGLTAGWTMTYPLN